MQALVGDRTASDFNLVLQIMLLAGLIVGAVLARRKRFDQHANVQTVMVLINLLLIIAIMWPSFYGYIIQGGRTTGRVPLLTIGHGVLGLIVELVAIYLIVRMRTNWIPERWRVRNIKAVMRGTLALWALLVLLGVWIYAEAYLVPRGVASAPLAEFRQLGADLYVHAVELDDAVKRGSEPAVKRHAEHLVNLIEGNKGLHYGDNDIDGHLEDPGDGIGLLARLDTVAGTVNDPAVSAQADDVRTDLSEIVASSIDVLGAPSVEQAAAPSAEIVELARQANGDGVFAIGQAAIAGGIVQAPGLVIVSGEEGEASTVTVSEIDYAFLPAEMTIPVGATVIWANDEQPKHTATADDGLFDSGDQNFGDSYSYTFDEPGIYPYFCRYHGDIGGVGMAGTITVD
jgi:plastocyanin